MMVCAMRREDKMIVRTARLEDGMIMRTACPGEKIMECIREIE